MANVPLAELGNFLMFFPPKNWMDFNKKHLKKNKLETKFGVFVDIPIGSMYGIYTYIWFIFMVNVAKYTIHGYYGIYFFAIVSVLETPNDDWEFSHLHPGNLGEVSPPVKAMKS